MWHSRAWRTHFDQWMKKEDPGLVCFEYRVSSCLLLENKWRLFCGPTQAWSWKTIWEFLSVGRTFGITLENLVWVLKMLTKSQSCYSWKILLHFGLFFLQELEQNSSNYLRTLTSLSKNEQWWKEWICRYIFFHFSFKICPKGGLQAHQCEEGSTIDGWNTSAYSIFLDPYTYLIYLDK